ncbi:MAG: hypothetical protein WCV91_01785 [Candidatus Margulisiibacteriota bacterium]
MQVQSKGTYFGPFLLSEGSVRIIKLNRQLASSGEMQGTVLASKKKKVEVILFAKREQLPDDIMLWINKVGNLDAAFAQYCENIMLCSSIRYKSSDGRIVYERGFTYSVEVGENIEELSDEAQGRVVDYDDKSPIFEGGPRLEISSLERTIFVNLSSDIEGKLYAGPAFFSVIAHEVGHLKNNVWIKNKNVGLKDFGLGAREFYALMYERNALIGLRNAVNPSGKYEALVRSSLNDSVIPVAQNRAVQRYAEMGAHELACFSFPPDFDINNLRLFRQYPVSMIG